MDDNTITHEIQTNLINRRLELLIMERENTYSLNKLTTAIMNITKNNNISINPEEFNGLQ